MRATHAAAKDLAERVDLADLADLAETVRADLADPAAAQRNLDHRRSGSLHRHLLKAGGFGPAPIPAMMRWRRRVLG